MQVSPWDDLTISDGQGTQISPNAFGDGVFISENGSATLADDTITNNTACAGYPVEGGGIFNSGVATLTHDTISNNTACAGGGGLYTVIGSTTTLNDDTISGNEGATVGGGVFNSGTTTLDDDTISGNVEGYTGSANAGGGIYNDTNSVVNLNADTIANNTAVYGGGIATATGSETYLSGTLIGDNTQSDGVCDVGGMWTDDGYNMSPDGSCELSQHDKPSEHDSLPRPSPGQWGARFAATDVYPGAPGGHS